MNALIQWIPNVLGDLQVTVHGESQWHITTTHCYTQGQEYKEVCNYLFD